jgi:hypothetical protein
MPNAFRAFGRHEVEEPTFRIDRGFYPKTRSLNLFTTISPAYVCVTLEPIKGQAFTDRNALFNDVLR